MDDDSFRRTRSKRTRLFDDLTEQYQSAKCARFQHVATSLIEDVDSDSSDAMSQKVMDALFASLHMNLVRRT